MSEWVGGSGGWVRGRVAQAEGDRWLRDGWAGGEEWGWGGVCGVMEAK